jgi:hypothetical protein
MTATRCLAAILAVDVVGCSRIGREDHCAAERMHDRGSDLAPLAHRLRRPRPCGDAEGVLGFFAVSCTTVVSVRVVSDFDTLLTAATALTADCAAVQGAMPPVWRAGGITSPNVAWSMSSRAQAARHWAGERDMTP